jgi:transposase
LTNGESAELEGISRSTVTKWRNPFAECRSGGLDEPLPARPRTITDAQVAAVIIKTLESRPADGSTHWSTRSMGREAGVTADAVMRIWHAFGL